MIYLFSSSYYKLYQKDVLDACCYPERHIMRLRYSENFVPESVKRSPTDWLNQHGLLIFADTERSRDGADFVFYPIREVQIVKIQLLAGILFVDVALGKFVNYGSENEKNSQELWNKTIRQLPERPHPPGSESEGYFFYVLAGQGISYSIRESENQVAWRSVIERINRSSLSECVTFQVLGFYRAGGPLRSLLVRIADRTSRLAQKIGPDNKWKRGTIRFLRSLEKLTESRVLPTVSGADCIYQFRMGELIRLNLLFYRSRHAPPVDRSLNLRADKHTFSSTSVERINVRYRYNQERIFLKCSRITDPALSSLSIIQGDSCDNTSSSPEPLFIVGVAPPRSFLLFVAVLFALGLCLLNIQVHGLVGLSSRHAWGLVLPRALGTLLVFAATWLFIRRIPLK